MIKGTYRFAPDYAIHPGEYLDELLESKGILQKELSERTGVSTKHISNIINGKANITPEFAHKLELVLGTCASYWISLDNQYQLDLIRLRGLNKDQEDWLSKWPYSHMSKEGWIPATNVKKERYINLLRFFRCATIEDTEKYYEKALAISYRQKISTTISKENVIVWLCKGEQDASERTLGNYSKEAFEDNLIKIRKLVKNTPDKFENELIDLCNEAGVALVFTKELPKTGICGATRRIRNGRTVLIQMSLRYKTNDHFWFTFFHEACHVLKHEGTIFIDFMKQVSDKYEMEANAFSSDYLIPPEKYKEFTMRGDFTSQNIQAFAQDMDLHPGIVVGRLQHDEYVPYRSNLNSLKMPLQWAS